MQKEFVTENFRQTQKLGGILAQELCGGEVICLAGDLGAGKTTFSQGLLKGLGAKGPFTSPTFLVMKQYHLSQIANRVTRNAKNKAIHDSRSTICEVYHIDAYRVTDKDILNLGWKEIIADKNNVVIIEWADRIKKIIPKRALWIKFAWLDENKRKINFK